MDFQVLSQQVASESSQARETGNWSSTLAIPKRAVRSPISEEEFHACHDGEVIETRLRHSGMLYLAGKEWATFTPYGGHVARVKVRKGREGRSVIDSLEICLPEGRTKALHFAMITDSSGIPIQSYFKNLTKTRFTALEDGAIIHTSLNCCGGLILASKTVAQFTRYPSFRVKVHITKRNAGCAISKVEILRQREDPLVQDFSLMFNGSGQLIDSFWAGLSPRKFNSLDEGSRIQTKLDLNGTLYIGSRSWGKFQDYPLCPVHVHIVKGIYSNSFVGRVELFPAGRASIIHRFSLIKNRDGHVKGSYYDALHSGAFDALDDGDTIETRLNQAGLLCIGNRRLVAFPNFPRCPATLTIVKGKEGASFAAQVDLRPPGKDFIRKVFSIVKNREGEVIDSFESQLRPERLNSYPEETFISTRLTRRGVLRIGGAYCGKFSSFPSCPVNVYLTKGKEGRSLFSKVEILREGMPPMIKRLSSIRDKHGNLIDTYLQALSPYRFNSLEEGAVIETWLNKWGALVVGAITCAVFYRYPGCRVFAHILKGESNRSVIGKIELLDKHERVLAAHDLKLVYDHQGQLLESYYGQLNTIPRSIRRPHVIIKNLKVDRYNGLKPTADSAYYFGHLFSYEDLSGHSCDVFLDGHGGISHFRIRGHIIPASEVRCEGFQPNPLLLAEPYEESARRAFQHDVRRALGSFTAQELDDAHKAAEHLSSGLSLKETAALMKRPDEYLTLLMKQVRSTLLKAGLTEESLPSESNVEYEDMIRTDITRTPWEDNY